MQKKLKSALAIVSLVGVVAIFFVACGDGEMIELNAEILERLGEAEAIFDGEVADKIDSIKQGTLQAPSSSSSEPESSSSEPPPARSSSSDDYHEIISSSSKAQSSSSTLAAQSSSSKAVSSSSKGNAPVGNCAEKNAKSGFTCGWDGYTSSTILTPGKVLKPASHTLPSGCTSVAWSYAPNNTEMALIYDCEELPAGGVSALGSKNYVLFAELTCEDGKHTNACNPKDGWSSKKAPELTGDCKWDKNPTTTARGGNPSGVTVVDSDNICGSTKSVVYKYDGGSKNWPSTGILSEWKNWDKKHEETYDVEATLNCPAYSQPVTSACDPLKVSAGADHIIECTCAASGQCQVEASICKADGKAASNKVTLKKDECVEVNVYGYNNQHYLPDVGMRCQTNNNTSFTVSVNGKSTTVAGNGLVPLGKMALNDNEFGTLCLTNGESIDCSGPGQ